MRLFAIVRRRRFSTPERDAVIAPRSVLAGRVRGPGRARDAPELPPAGPRSRRRTTSRARQDRRRPRGAFRGDARRSRVAGSARPIRAGNTAGSLREDTIDYAHPDESCCAHRGPAVPLSLRVPTGWAAARSGDRSPPTSRTSGSPSRRSTRTALRGADPALRSDRPGIRAYNTRDAARAAHAPARLRRAQAR
jgi:hypothetical protein